MLPPEVPRRGKGEKPPVDRGFYFFFLQMSEPITPMMPLGCSYKRFALLFSSQDWRWGPLGIPVSVCHDTGYFVHKVTTKYRLPYLRKLSSQTAKVTYVVLVGPNDCNEEFSSASCALF